MAQLLTVKDQLITHEFDDLVGIFEDGHKFTEHEKLVFNIYQVHGFDRLALSNNLKVREMRVERIFKAPRTRWTNERALHDTAWRDTDGRWYFLRKDTLRWTLSDLTRQDKDVLASPVSLSNEKLNAFAKIKWTVDRYPENLEQVPQMTEV